MQEPSRRIKSIDESDREPNLEKTFSQKSVQLNNSRIGKRSRSPRLPSSVPIIQIQPTSSTIYTKCRDDIPVLNRTTSIPSSIPQRGAQNLEVDRNGHLIAPLPQQQNQAQADLARFVMSSTAQSSMFNAIRRSHSGTSSSNTVTAGSGVKHAGSLSTGILRTIAPEEVSPINAVGDMVWDPERIVWAKNRRRRSVGTDEDISEDVFRDISRVQPSPETREDGSSRC
ncbi:hypothetical protein BS47DRAFT_329586 [Hydnum rufescens UP504]|uniref:Uncharacterized protein n=1 Tax=Hydnum rufescens UP504 TaxID=1448309 RepID=A0A9P6B5R9_9AGAM|nr:hypothetical protein BS47DRAFT_329586 [Hydnum rufescens UP504]